jgi:endonuclease III
LFFLPFFQVFHLSFSQTSSKDNIDAIFSEFERQNNKPLIELQYFNYFTLLVAIVLSAQSTDVGVNKATKNLFALHKTPESFLALGVDGLKPYISSIGLYNNKAKNVIALSQKILQEHKGLVPQDFESLIKLPGVGRKTANVFLNTAFGAPRIGVDTHVFRVARRIGLSKGENELQVEKDLIELIPSKWLNRASHWLVLHGRYICKAKKPLCHSCNISSYCDYYNKL